MLQKVYNVCSVKLLVIFKYFKMRKISKIAVWFHFITRLLNGALINASLGHALIYLAPIKCSTYIF